MSVSVIVKNAASTIGEGPYWDVESKCLYYVDINVGDVHKWDSLTGEDTKVHFDKTVGFVIPQKSGGFVAGLGQTVSHFTWGNKEHRVLAEVDQGKETRFNDAKCDASGRLWCGTMSSAKERAKRIPKTGSLFSLEKDQPIKTQLSGVDISNGLAWTRDNRMMYYIDTDPGKVYAFDFDVNAGVISNQRTAVDMQALGIRPDGMCIDNEDKLWIACLRGSKIGRFDPETGKEIQKVELPTSHITSCCFGGENMNELFVTSMCRGAVEDATLLQREPLAGSVFKVTGLGVTGPAAPMYQA